MNDSDHDRLLAVAAKWEQLHGELFVKAQRLTIERDDLLESWRRLDVTHRMALEEIARARALISWIDGACVDEEGHMVIRAAINRFWEASGG